MKRLRTNEPENIKEANFNVPKSYIKNKNTVNELQELCDFYGIDYTDDFIKDDYVRYLRKLGKKHWLKKLDLVYKNPMGGAGEIKLTRAWLDIAKEVVSESVNALLMSKKEIFELIDDEIETRYRKSKNGEYDSDHPKYMSNYKYKKCDIAYRTFMSYLNNENDYKGLDEKSAQLLTELQDFMKRKSTRQKADVIKNMLSNDRKGWQRDQYTLQVADDKFNLTKKVDKKLDWQMQIEEMMSDIADKTDDLTGNSDNETESDKES